MKKRITAVLLALSLAAASCSAAPVMTAEAAGTTVNSDSSTTVTSQSRSGDVVTTRETTTTATNAKFVTVTTKNVLSGETTIDMISYDSTGKQLSESSYEVRGVEGNTVKLLSLKTEESTAIVPDSIVSCGMVYYVYKIGALAMVNNESTTRLVIGENVIAIGAAAFSGCKKLKSVTINSDEINYVGDNAFDGINSKATISIRAKGHAYKNTAKWIRLSGIEKTVKYKKI